MSDAVAELVRLADPPLYVVTTTAGGERAGCVVGFASQVSVDPPRFLAALSIENRTWTVARAASHLAVHVVRPERVDLVDLFGGETGDEVDKFARCAWSEGPGGLPILDGAAAWLVGTIVERLDFGDHIGHVLAPVAGSAETQAGDTVTLHDADGLQAGHPA